MPGNANAVARRERRLKVVIASGSNDPKLREAMEQADAYLQKPYTAETPLRLVAHIFRGAAD